MHCIINGDQFTFDQSMNIQEILQSLELDEQRVIVEHNEQLIKREQFPNQIVREQDRLELLEFVGGG
ncbi:MULTISPECIES: sulfur carrier protein ThiS [Staphylococcus]|uniref:Sulfur carrier protein ThiS n=1 Tax=Staphylococcus hsinchuensis TaxID=3051183 RepID=A0ABZ3EDW6_9STAP|nr:MULTISPECIES: sulfur carrier protein ThiS [unclassified Staphylococcus]